jgi:hypothetical protein
MIERRSRALINISSHIDFGGMTRPYLDMISVKSCLSNPPIEVNLDPVKAVTRR